jgi:hypothetical protein
MRTRHLGLGTILTVLFTAAPAQAQGDFIKDHLKELIEKSGVYLSVSSRSSIDNEVDMGRSIGIGYGTAGSKRTGWKFPFSFSGYRGDLQTEEGNGFGQFRARQIMSGVGYQWVHGKMVYGAQLGVGYSFNKVTIADNAPAVFGTEPPVNVDVSNSWVLRPQVKAEYFLHHKLSLRTQVSYTYSDPDVIVTTASSQFQDEWRPHHLQLSAAVGVFPFRKR